MEDLANNLSGAVHSGIGRRGGRVGGGAAQPVDTPAVSIFTAIDGLGLKLEARKAPVDVLVVDHVAGIGARYRFSTLRAELDAAWQEAVKEAQLLARLACSNVEKYHPASHIPPEML